MAVAFGRRRLVARTVSGRWIGVPFAAGFLSPSPTESNLSAPAETARLLQTARDALGTDGKPGGRAVFALPDRTVHVALETGAARGDLRRLRSGLVAGLTAGSGRADPGLERRFRFGAMPTGPRARRTVLGAVSAAAVVSQYEAAAEAAGLRAEWLDAVSLAPLPEWLASDGRSGPRVLLLLHRRHFVLAAADGMRLTGFRMRLRARLDPEPPVLAVRRLAADRGRRAAVWGDGAEAVSTALGRDGIEVEAPRVRRAASAVSPVVDAALAALLRRVGARPAPLAAAPVSPAAQAA